MHGITCTCTLSWNERNSAWSEARDSCILSKDTWNQPTSLSVYFFKACVLYLMFDFLLGSLKDYVQSQRLFFHNRNSKDLFIIDSQHRLLGEIVNKKQQSSWINYFLLCCWFNNTAVNYNKRRSKVIVSDLRSVPHVGGFGQPEARGTSDVYFHLVELTVHLHNELQQVPLVILSEHDIIGR